MRQFDCLFALRPSVVCNYDCSYCYRQDFLDGVNKQTRFDIDSMLWHSMQRLNNLFNFCGYGETMMHPQFGDMIIELSKITNVNWVTNGTMFGNGAFKNILSYADHKNILDVVISVHVDQIKDPFKYAIEIRRVKHELDIRGIRYHLTSIITNENIDKVIMFRRYLPEIIIKHPFEIYSQGGKIIKYGYTEQSQKKMASVGIVPEKDWIYGDMGNPPYTGRLCTNGVSILEVMHDGMIYDCSFDENRVVIGDINKKEPIKSLSQPRLCKSSCTTCIPMLRNSFGLVK